MNYENTEIAIGVYPLVYLINHRCSPNAIFVFDGLTLILRSIKPIHKNEEISVVYSCIILISRFLILILLSLVIFVISINHWYFLIYSILKEGYSFKCCCPLCKDLQRDKKLYSFRCSCGGIQYPTIENCSNRPGIMSDILFIKYRIMGLW